MRLLIPLLLLACADGTQGKNRITPPNTDPDRGAPLPITDAIPDGAPSDAGENPPDADDMGQADSGANPDAALDPDAAPIPDPDAAPIPGPDAAPDPDAALPDAPIAICGDGQTQPGEACDDGNQADGDYCSADCAATTGRCGDGLLQDNEGCDDGVVMADCGALHDGGDGACRPAGQCSPGYNLEGGACVPGERVVDVEIFVDNFCNMQVRPESVTVPPGQTADFRYHNRSRDYEVDVWMSYGGGFLDLGIGQTWDEPIVDCGADRVQRYYADVSTACSEFRFHIECQ